MDAFREELKSLVEIPSVNGAAEAGMPFGKDIDRALDRALEIWKSYGFQVTKDADGYYGYADLGQGEKLFGILCHLDVVPVGNLEEWQRPPFELFEDEEYYYGRGVADDKAPGLIALHALTDLLKEGHKLKLPVRFVFGTDEETDWRCIDRYRENQERVPDFGIVPDADFPVVFMERSILQVDLHSDRGGEIHYKGGEAYNVVPGEAGYPKPPVTLFPALQSIGAKWTETETGIKVLGKNAHAAESQNGHNALVDLLSALHLADVDSKAARFVYDKMLDGPNGEKLFGFSPADPTTMMNLNLGLCDLSESSETLSLDMRLPVGFTIEDAIIRLSEICEPYDLKVIVKSRLESIHVPLESDFMKDLLSSYYEVTGDDTAPIVSGGGTYARAFPNFVAFGASLPGVEQQLHQPNERFAKTDIMTAYQIYQAAFKKLLIEE